MKKNREHFCSRFLFWINYLSEAETSGQALTVEVLDFEDTVVLILSVS
jgi:hypothetical protein